MEAKCKPEKLIAGPLEPAGCAIKKIKGNPSLEVSHKQHTPGASPDMVRVTDELGAEYLCPVSATRGSFVEGSAKRDCFHYSVISKNILSFPP
jgi:hypothetical protein